MGLSKYKYLVTVGCSQTYGQGISEEETWSYKLAKELGLKEINLACNGAGHYYIENILTSFIHNNKDILNECLVIIQNSTLERRLNYDEIPLASCDYFSEHKIDFIPAVGVAALGFKDWSIAEKDYEVERIDEVKNHHTNRMSGQWVDIGSVDTKMIYFPEHKHYANSRHNWKIGPEHKDELPFIKEQFEELMLYWAKELYSLHLFLTSQNLDHIFVDGYSPFVSHKLNFKNYFTSEEELEWCKEFWSTSTKNEQDPDDIMVYDFKNIKSAWLFDLIDSKYKIDDVVLWSLYQFKEHGSDWNIDGGHAGKLGMDLIKNAIKQNLESKGWI